MSDTLFTLPQPHPHRKGHAADPGSGPDSETCGSCDHYTRRSNISGHKIFRKCWLMKEHWTCGPVSDIRAKDPACRYWTAEMPEARDAQA